jgi:FKBP-type peptidyl-prolyl cis-trans isomerase
MKVDQKIHLVCPRELAYRDGIREGMPVVPGGATLIYELQLSGIVSAVVTAR